MSMRNYAIQKDDNFNENFTDFISAALFIWFLQIYLLDNYLRIFIIISADSSDDGISNELIPDDTPFYANQEADPTNAFYFLEDI